MNRNFEIFLFRTPLLDGTLIVLLQDRSLKLMRHLRFVRHAAMNGIV